MARPPDDDAGLDEVLERVERALDELPIVDGDARAALLDGVRQALGELGLEGEGSPAIPVVDGGRGDGDPTSEAPRPDLRVADCEDDGGGGTQADGRVRVVRVERGSHAGHAGYDGVIRVAGAGVWQTVSRAASARAYRLWCSAGTLRVAIDGLPADTLQAGQSLDVEARLLRVASADGSEARGRYVRLRG